MKKRITVAAILCILTLLLAGCVETFPVTVRGGGWLLYYGDMQQGETETTIEGKTTFGFTVKCYDAILEDDLWVFDVKGIFTYIDHFNKIKIKGSILGASTYEEGAAFGGEYTVDGVTGDFAVYVYDGGELGETDYFEVHVLSGLYEGYVNIGPLGGGNIRLFTSSE